MILRNPKALVQGNTQKNTIADMALLPYSTGQDNELIVPLKSDQNVFEDGVFKQKSCEKKCRLRIFRNSLVL